MKSPEKNPLLNDVLDDVSLDTLRDDSLDRGLIAMRARVRRRRQFQAAAIMVPLAFLILQLRLKPTVRPPEKPAPARSQLADTDKVKYITDKELLALFPGRPVALIGEPGHQRFLLLDELGASNQ